MFLPEITQYSPQNQFQRQPAPCLTMYATEHRSFQQLLEGALATTTALPKRTWKKHHVHHFFCQSSFLLSERLRREVLKSNLLSTTWTHGEQLFCFTFLIWVRSPKEFNSSKIQIHLTDIANWNLKEREFTESFYSRRFFCRLRRRCISSVMSYFTYTNRTTP